MTSDILHTGVAHDENPPGRGSGRYGWGTGKNPGQHQFNFISEIESYRKQGLTDDEIAKIMISPNSKASELKQLIYSNTSIDTNDVKELRAQGKTEKEIAEILLGKDFTVAEYKAKLGIAEKRERDELVSKVTDLYAKTGGNASEVGRILNINESSVRNYLKPKSNKYIQTAEELKKKISESPSGIIDVSKATELYLGVTENTKKIAIAMLQEEGYVKSWIKVDQMGTTESTTMMVLAAPPDTSKGETIHDVYRKIQQNKFDVSSIVDYSPDGGVHFFTPEDPVSIDSKRVYIRYGDQGGKDKDGVLEIRKGVKDLTLGGANYAQVRVGVDDTHYMKGMAVYSDDIPDGYDIVYNTNKKTGAPLMGEGGVLKEMKKARDNPFGATIKAGGQTYYPDKNGNYVYSPETHGYKKATKSDKGERYSLSPINKINEEGDWDTWARNLSSQFLSKQPLKLINQQLDISIKSKQAELDEIKRLTNPIIKKQMLEDFADNCDTNSASLAAKGFKRQAFQVILPVTKLKPTEVYAPNYDDGDTVALVRYPHAGTFEIPILKVNNKDKNAKSILGQARDAIGIHPSVAEQLSGADFDGDSVLVIPLTSNNLSIKATKPLKELEGWDNKAAYSRPAGTTPPKDSVKQALMGQVSNLITDMTVAGAPERDIVKAVKHSMVVIDCVKHNLDYKKSEADNDIIALKKEYQGVSKNGQAKGASTILSRAGAQAYVNKRKEVTDIRKMTPEQLKAWQAGKKIFEDTGEVTTKKRIKDPDKMTPEEKELYLQGKKVYRDIKPKITTQKTKTMYTVDDATYLVRDKNNEKEMAYARYANTLKSLADEARREYRSIKPTPVDQTAKQTYKKEVDELLSALRVAESNSPREREAQRVANKIMRDKIKSDPSLELDKEHLSRERNLALTRARAAVGAHKEKIEITDKQWEAIQANALSTNRVSRIIRNSNPDRVKQLATPKDIRGLTPAQLSKAKAMLDSNMYTNAEIAQLFGVSVSTLYRALNE